MPLEAPFWWYRRKGALASALAPLGSLYGRIAEKRFADVTPYRSRLPVICIGNFTAGGGGKTPTAIAVAALLKQLGRRARFPHPRLWRREQGAAPRQAGRQRRRRSAMSRCCWRKPRRPWFRPTGRQGAKAIEATEASVIVMDDGFQNPSLAKDLSLVVVDGAVGVGNGLVIPAGPLRAPLDAQIARASALVVIGDADRVAKLIEAFTAQAKPVLKARMVPRQDRRWLSVLPVIGFAGIARPAKFFATLRNEGARLIDTRAYPDHYRYSERQARSLLERGEGLQRHAGHHREGLCAARGRTGFGRGRAEASRPPLPHRGGVRGQGSGERAACGGDRYSAA